MKSLRQILTLILSAYLLVLMVMPCSEGHSEIEKQAETQLSRAEMQHHHDTELCTPFCVCGSCVNAIVLQPITDFQVLKFNAPSRDISNFYRSVTSSFYGAIWQPPQLV